eukprot:1593827-Rhodomonas_salina.2
MDARRGKCGRVMKENEHTERRMGGSERERAKAEERMRERKQAMEREEASEKSTSSRDFMSKFSFCTAPGLSVLNLLAPCSSVSSCAPPPHHRNCFSTQLETVFLQVSETLRVLRWLRVPLSNGLRRQSRPLFDIDRLCPSDDS